MTKIKNTKKGMAKKTLSMSLVVAMLATSNVPVWAAEFSDGSDVAVTSDAEASVAETFSDDVTETPVVEDTTDNTAVATAAEVSSDSFSVTPEFTDNANNAIKDNAVTWGTTVKAKFKVTETYLPKIPWVIFGLFSNRLCPSDCDFTGFWAKLSKSAVAYK